MAAPAPKGSAGHRRALLLVVLAQLLGLYCFTRGFLLTRYETAASSACAAPPTFAFPDASSAGDTGGNNHNNHNKSQSCWFPRRYKRAVIILVDALRYDFAAWDATFASKQLRRKTSAATSAAELKRAGSSPAATAPAGPAVDDDPRRFHLNHLPVIREHVAADRRRARRTPSMGRHSLLYRFEADPPTVTMQRLKGLMTGGMPTFIDFKDNFGTSDEVTVDNFLRQLVTNDRRVVFMGDDTWTDLFPPAKYFYRSFPFPSFNVKDLDTVDRGVTSHLLPMLERNAAKRQEHEDDADDWDVIIGHYLGIDHAGHTFSPQHPSMTRKLEELDGVLRRVFSAADKDTLVAVFGDHGMTKEGNHGGSSSQEKRSALFLYSHADRAAPLTEPPPQHPGQDGGDFERLWWKQEESVLTTPRDNKEGGRHVHHGPRTVAQIDILPTLCLLLGVPIPFENLGKIIPELFYHGDDGSAGLKNSKKGDTNSLLAASSQRSDESVFDPDSDLDLGANTLHSESHAPTYTCEDVKSAARLGAALRINALQILRYIQVYGTSLKVASSVSVPVDKHARFLRKALGAYEQASGDARAICPGSGGRGLPTESQQNKTMRLAETMRRLQRANRLISRFVDDVYHACRRQWTQFDIPKMVAGLVFMAGSLLFSAWHFDFFRVVLGLLCACRGSKKTENSGTATETRPRKHAHFPRFLPIDLCAIVSGIFMCISHFSNSYIEAEADISSFLSVTMCSALAYVLLQTAKPSTKVQGLPLYSSVLSSPALLAIAAMICIRISSPKTSTVLNAPVTPLGTVVPLFAMVFLWAWAAK